jgi:exodeoxyribonuclease-3
MSLRVMTYNILDGGKDRESHILQIIRLARPDVVILQEVIKVDFLKLLSQSLGMAYFIGARNRKRKVALLSRLPVCSFNSYHSYLPTWRNFIDAEIEYIPNKTFRLIGIHQIANLSIAFELWRLLDANYLIKYIRKFNNKPCLIAGDFNAVAPTDKFKTDRMPNWLKWIIYLQGNRVYRFSIKAFLSTGFTDCFRFLNSKDDGYTLPPPDPNTRLDYIFVNASMRAHLKRCWVVHEPNIVNWASDHFPVMAEFSFNQTY